MNHIVIEGLYIEGQDKDTLLYAGEARVRITDWFILKKGVPVLKYVGLHNAYAKLYRRKTSDKWNYDFIIDAFDTGPSTKKKDTTSQNFEIDLKKVDLSNVRFHMDDAWVGNDMDFDVGKFVIDANKVDMAGKQIDVDEIIAENTSIVFRDYDGGRPPKPKSKIKVIDTTAFNTGNWLVKLNKISLEHCLFSNDIGTEEPIAGEFDPEHIYIRDINIDAQKISITGDTIKGKIKDLSAKERCGLVLKKLKADVTVSPNASICKNLYLETANSRLFDYYAMHYERFPDFNDYINKVVMVARLKGATINSKDVAYFAPQLKEYPTVINASGSFYGTVDSITGRSIVINDGRSVVKGNLRMIGLPDIDNTFIDYNNGEFYTNAEGIYKYAPGLRNNADINLGSITHAYFKGSFTGYIENFAADGILVTNIGTIESKAKLKMPGLDTRNASYSGTITTSNFNLGALLRQSDIGAMTLNATISGSSFDPARAEIILKSTIPLFEYRGYAYHNITADGTLSKNKFVGNALIDDPNLSLAFYGGIDLSQKEVKINARANLLQSNLAALKLTRDSIRLNADFDLDCTGSSIDNFTGYAKLFNINLVRNGHRLDLDSIYAFSSNAEGKKSITLQSNILYAKVSGNYQLSSLPYSIQYYVSQYIPNYIKSPEKYAPEQDLSFEMETQEIDSMLAVLAPDIKGFNKSTLNGTLNTSRHQLTLNGDIPYGRIVNVKMHNVSLKGEGNLNVLGINADAEKIVLGDSAASGSMSITATIGNDSLNFNIATNSPDAYGTATINGRAVAKGDSLHFTMLPSEFYLNKTKWDIPGGYATLSGSYLFVQNLVMHSSTENITLNSITNNAHNALNIAISNLDVSELGKLANISSYEPYGRINGTVRVDNPLDSSITIYPSLKATEVRFGTDTIGDVNITGSYQVAANIIRLDEQSGIYKNNSSIQASGKIVLFDKESKQTLDGIIQFNNTPVSWISPLLVGYVSRISGNLDGKVSIAGTSKAPDVQGSVKMTDAGMRIDFLGTYYKIPKANITVSNSEINLGNITLQDVNKNKAILAGTITHNRFNNMRLNLNMGSSKFEVINLKERESELFYGDLIAGFQNMSVTGPLDDISINIYKARPTQKSHLYLPIGGSGTSGTYNYVTFKSYDTTNVIVRKPKYKLSIDIEAILNDLAEITMVLDPSTGDAINAIGTGNIKIEIPSSNSIRMYGNYNIDKGDYTFTLKQLLNFKRKFDLNPGSTISFYGPISQTALKVEGSYTVRTSLYPLIPSNQRSFADSKELSDARATQEVDILLYMGGSLQTPKLSFKLDIPDKRLTSNLAYRYVELLNQNDNALASQVVSLLLVGSFLPSDGTGLASLNTGTGAISNIGEIISGTASTQLNKLMNKITKDDKLSFDFKYKAYNPTDDIAGGSASVTNTRSAAKLSATYNVNDRLSVQVGSAYDWGKAGGNNTSSLAGDFRGEWQIKEGGNLRLNIFRTSNYDAIALRNINRGGLGITWRKSFNTFGDFFRSAKAIQRREDEQLPPNADSVKDDTGGTW